MKYQNNDYPNPSHKVVMRRYFGDISKIRLFWADGWLFGQSAITCHVVGKNTDDVADDLNHTLLQNGPCRIMRRTVLRPSGQ